MERWANIYDGRYQVSSHGRIKSFAQRKPRIMRLQSCTNGYVQVRLTTFDGVCRNVSVHRLVAETFLPNPKHLPEVNHLDRVRTNNRITNLEWASMPDNRVNGEEHHQHKLTADEVLAIRAAVGYTQQELADAYGIDQTQVSRIRSRRQWQGY